MPISAPPTSSIVRCAASRGAMPARKCRSAFSTTTIASSTTMPIDSTRPNIDRLFSEKPKTRHDRERADQRHRDREQRDDRRAPALQEQHHDDHRENHRLEQRFLHRVHRGARERHGVENDLVGDARRELALQLLHRVADVVPGLERVGVRRLLHAQRHGGLEALVRVDRVVLRAELHARDVADARDASLRVALDDRVRELLGRRRAGPARGC